MGFTTPTELEIDFYRNYFHQLLQYFHEDARDLFLGGCMDGTALAVRAIPPVTSSTLNPFEPLHHVEWGPTLREQEKRALAQGVVGAPYSTGFCIGFWFEGFVRANGLLFANKTLAEHTITLAQIIIKTAPIFIDRTHFIRFAADATVQMNTTFAKKQRDLFIEILRSKP